MPWHAPVCFDVATEGREADESALGTINRPLRTLGYSGFSIIVVWVVDLMFSLYRRGCFAASSRAGCPCSASCSKNKNTLASRGDSQGEHCHAEHSEASRTPGRDASLRSA